MFSLFNSIITSLKKEKKWRDLIIKDSIIFINWIFTIVFFHSSTCSLASSQRQECSVIKVSQYFLNSLLPPNPNWWRVFSNTLYVDIRKRAFIKRCTCMYMYIRMYDVTIYVTYICMSCTCIMHTCVKNFYM